MDRADRTRFGGRFHPRRLVLSLFLGGLLGLGCAQFPTSGLVQPNTIARGANPAQDPAYLPPPATVTPSPALQERPKARLHFEEIGDTNSIQPPPAPKQIPVTLDSVLRLANDQNLRVHMARGKVQEAFVGVDLAAKAWLPDLWIGTSYYRHEGGIQNPDGTVISPSFGSLFAGGQLQGKLDLRDLVYQKINAERSVWQQKGELARITNEQLLDASTTYVDLLAAKAGEAISLTQETYLEELLTYTQGVAKVDPGMEVAVQAIRAELASQKQTTRKLRGGFKMGSAKLAYLLGLDPMADLVLLDRQFAPFNLIDPHTPVSELVHQALTTGPGVREVEGLLNLIHEANEKNRGIAPYLPTFTASVAEGAFGGGPGSGSDWNNRLDLLLQVRWNLTDVFTRNERQRLAQAKIGNLHDNYQDIRGRLTLGVQEAHEAIQSGGEQMALAEDQISHARDNYDRSRARWKNKIGGGSPSEVMFAARSLGLAQLNYLSAIRDYDKAQLRLLLLLGPNCGTGSH